MGSEFWVELPLPAADESDLKAAFAAEADDVRVLRGARVLIGEDNAVNMMITAGLLEQWGVQVGQATDGVAVVDAVQAADARRRAVPCRADGPADAASERPCRGARAARALGERAPPIIALTAAALVSERDEALRAGMCEFLTKPVHAERLRSVLAHWVGRGRA